MAATSVAITPEYTAPTFSRTRNPRLWLGLAPKPAERRREDNADMTGRLLFAVLVAAGFAGGFPDPQPPGPPPLTFRAEANLVEVDAFVSDATGKPVTDLQARDFQLLEDGKPQMGSAFSYAN